MAGPRKSLLFNGRNLLLTTVVLGFPCYFYTVLVDRRLRHRLPLVVGDDLPKHLAKAPQFGIQPKINYSEGYFADVPKKWFLKRQYLDEFARVFFKQNAILDLESDLLSLANKAGVAPLEMRKPSPSAGEKFFLEPGTVLDDNGVFQVESTTSNETHASYWFTKPSTLLGGVHTLAWEPVAHDKRLVRVWFINHLSLNVPSDSIKAKPAVSDWEDPELDATALTSMVWKQALWWHRLYARYLLDWTLGRMLRNWQDAKWD